jgi:alpha-galactosidase
VRQLDTETAKLLLNRSVLALNQDALGVPARRVRREGLVEVWKKPLADGSVGVALVNRGGVGQDFSLRAGDIGLLDTPKLVHNLWSEADVADFKAELPTRVQPHETLLFKVTAS